MWSHWEPLLQTLYKLTEARQNLFGLSNFSWLLTAWKVYAHLVESRPTQPEREKCARHQCIWPRKRCRVITVLGWGTKVHCVCKSDIVQVYCVTRRKLSALVQFVKQHWHCLQGTRFCMRIDHALFVLCHPGYTYKWTACMFDWILEYFQLWKTVLTRAATPERGSAFPSALWFLLWVPIIPGLSLVSLKWPLCPVFGSNYHSNSHY